MYFFWVRKSYRKDTKSSNQGVFYKKTWGEHIYVNQLKKNVKQKLRNNYDCLNLTLLFIFINLVLSAKNSCYHSSLSHYSNLHSIA